jgi:cyclophilin family peptidyl-prolyl cis-trans isomerase
MIPSTILLASFALAQPLNVFCVNFKLETIDEPFTVTINSTLAPLGAERFYQLVQERFYDDSPFFRIVDNFVDQFGLSGIPAINKKWGNETIKDDPVLTTNSKTSLSFATAGPDTRTTQVFINTRNNPSLDGRGFSPFGYVTSGWDTVTKIVNPTPNDRGGIDQDNIANFGNNWVRSNYPNTTFIETASFVSCV